MLSTYLSYRMYAQNPANSVLRTSSEPAVAHEAKYYRDNIGKVKSIDDFLGNYRLYAYAMKAYGLEDMTYAKGFMKKVLESDLTDKNSFASKLSDTRYLDFAKAFNFRTDGSLANTATIQATTQEADTLNLYSQYGTGVTTGATTETAYYNAHIGNVTNVDDLLNNDRLRTYVLKAFSLDPNTTSTAAVRQALTSDLTDLGSYANMNTRFLPLARAFSFNTDGSLNSGVSAQTTAYQTYTTGLYGNVVTSGVSSLETTINTNYYKSNISKMKSANALLSNTRLMAYIRNAYDLNADTVSNNTIKLALESDVSDPNSYVNRQGDSGLKALVADFNFASDGSLATQRVVQSAKSGAATAAAYTAAAGTGAAAVAAAKTETAYYWSTIVQVKSLDDLLKDTRLVSYVVKAFGLSTQNPSTATLRKVLTSDLSQKNSFANQQVDARYRTLAAAFNFNANGTIARESTQEAQTRTDVQSTYDLYIRQTMETEAGSQNEGTRLALYFQRKAPSITSAYDILGDKALLTVVQTALNIPATTSLADLDAQAKMITSKLNLKDLQDPQKVDKFLARFSALYDMNNNSYSTQSSAVTLLTPSDQTGIGADLLASVLGVNLSGTGTSSSSAAAILLSQSGQAGITADLLTSLQTVKSKGG